MMEVVHTGNFRSNGTSIDEGQQQAIDAYYKATGRTFIPGAIIPIATDALVFAEYQQPWKTLEEFKEKRCRYDPETNEWLVHYVTHEMLRPEVPMIYVDILKDGVALVDGTHRVTGHLIRGREIIWAHTNQ